jgi:hypothetical protein
MLVKIATDTLHTYLPNDGSRIFWVYLSRSWLPGGYIHMKKGMYIHTWKTEDFRQISFSIDHETRTQ